MPRIQITTNDDMIYEAVTARGIVSKMRRSRWVAPELKHDYMTEVSQSVAAMYSSNVRTDSCEHFLEDLQVAGLIVERRTIV